MSGHTALQKPTALLMTTAITISRQCSVNAGEWGEPDAPRAGRQHVLTGRPRPRPRPVPLPEAVLNHLPRCE